MGLLDLFQEVIVFALGLARMLALFALLPVFNRTILPGSARNGAAISMSLAVYPLYATSIDIDAHGGALFATLLVKETIIGGLMGFGLSLIFYAVGAMGFLIDNQRGSTMASSVDPMTGAQTSPTGIFMMQVLGVYFFVSGAAFVVLLGVYESYRVFPVGAFLPDLSADGVTYFLSILDRIFALALLMAAPAMIAMFLSEFGLGLVSRFAPQLNVFFLAMPVKSAVGLLLLALYVAFLPQVWDAAFSLAPLRIEILNGLFR